MSFSEGSTGVQDLVPVVSSILSAMFSGHTSLRVHAAPLFVLGLKSADSAHLSHLLSLSSQLKAGRQDAVRRREEVSDECSSGVVRVVQEAPGHTWCVFSVCRG